MLTCIARRFSSRSIHLLSDSPIHSVLNTIMSSHGPLGSGLPPELEAAYYQEAMNHHTYNVQVPQPIAERGRLPADLENGSIPLQDRRFSTETQRRNGYVQSTNPNIKERIAENLRDGVYDCSVCMTTILPETPGKPTSRRQCLTCHCVLHLECAQKWASRTTDPASLPWKCPSCRAGQFAFSGFRRVCPRHALNGTKCLTLCTGKGHCGCGDESGL
jgi:hypothetical protein